MQKKIMLIHVFLTVTILSPLPASAGMESDSYYIPASVISGGGGSPASDTYQADATLGQPFTCITQESDNFTLYPGFRHAVETETVLDYDNDGMLDGEDNCPRHPNGASLGTCANIRAPITPCSSDIACGGMVGSCSMNQEDSFPPQGNACGNACECEGNYDGDPDQDGTDAFIFKQDYGRSIILRPCTSADPCNGDLVCDHDVDGTDAFTFKSDFGRSAILNPCPDCVTLPWCLYP